MEMKYKSVLVYLIILIACSFSVMAISIPDPQVFYDMDDSSISGSTLDDLRDYQDGTLQNSPTTGEAGKYNEGILFDANSEQIYMSTSLIISDGTGASTICAWVNLTSLNSGEFAALSQLKQNTGTQHVISFYNNAGTYQLRAGFRRDNPGDNRGAGITLTSSEFLNTWKHVCYVFSGGTKSTQSNHNFYIDGVLDETGKFTVDSGGSGSNNWIHNDDGGGLQDGDFVIDEWGVWRSALSADQIVAINNSLTGYPYNANPNITSVNISNTPPIKTNDVIDVQFAVDDNDEDILNLSLTWYYSTDNATWINHGSDNQSWSDQGNSTYKSSSYQTSATGDLEAADTTAWQYWYAEVTANDSSEITKANSSTILIENTPPVVVSNSSGTTFANPVTKGETLQFNVTGTDAEGDNVKLKVCSGSSDTWQSCTLLCENAVGVAFDTVNETSITCDYVTTESERSNNAYAILNDTGNVTSLINISYFVNEYPLLENFTMQDTSGNQVYYFGEYIDYFRIDQDDAFDNDTLQTYITVTDPDSEVRINNVSLENISGNTEGYETNLYLDAVGNWTIQFECTDSDDATSTYNASFIVNTIVLNTSGRLYGYDHEGLFNHSVINNSIQTYEYYFAEVRINISSNWSEVTLLAETMKNDSQLLILTLWDDLSNQSGTLSFISDNYADLIGGDILNAMRAVKLYVADGTTENAENSGIINNITKRIFQNISNRFPVYTRNYNHSDLNSNYATVDPYIYINAQNQSDLIKREIGYMRNSTDKSRFYYNMTTPMQSAALNWQNDIIDKFRSNLITPTVTNENVAELSNGDLIVGNSNATDDIYNITMDISYVGFDVYDYTSKIIIEQSNDQNISINVNSGTADLLYITNLSKIETNADDEIFLYSVDAVMYPDTVDLASASANAFQFVTSSANPEDARILLTDPTYNEADYYVWYGEDGAEAVGNFSKYEITIIADSSNGVWVGGLGNVTETYGYLSVNDYGNNNNPVGCTPGVDCTTWNRTYWLENKKSNISVWTDIQDNIHVFIDGLDIGEVNDIDGLFGDAMVELTDYVKVSKQRNAILNTYTSYESYANLGDYTMRESACARWNGTVSNPEYEYEDIALDVQRANFHKYHNIPVLAQSFGNITDYEKAYYCYMQNKVLYGDLMKYSFNQPDFEHTGSEDDFQWNIFKYPDLGVAIEDDYTVSGDSYSRRFERGIVSVNTTARTVDYDNAEVILNLEFCGFYYDNDDGAADEGYMHFVINDNLSKNFDVTDTDLTAFVKTWKCVNVSTDFYEPSGFYEMEFYYIDSDASYLNNNGLYMYHDTISGNDRLSFWDNTLNDHPVNDETDYTYYATGDNWAINFTINAIRNDTILDQIDSVISRNTAGVEKLTVTYESDNSWNLSIFDKVQFMNKTQFNGIFVNSTALNYTNSSACTSNSPEYSSTVVDDETWQACYYDSAGDGYHVKVVVPRLSTKNFTIDGNTNPELENETLTILNMSNGNQTWELNYTVTDADNNTVLNCQAEIDGINIVDSPSGNDCSITINYLLNGTQFNIYPFAQDEYSTSSLDGLNQSIAKIDYDGIQGSSTIGDFNQQYFLKYWNITQNISDFDNILWSYENLTARTINLSNGSTNDYLDYATQVIITSGYDFTPDGGNAYTVDAGEEVFRYFNVTGNLSTGETVPEFNITMEMENYVSGAQSMNHICGSYDSYGSGNYTTGSTFTASILSTNDTDTACYQYLYAGKVIYSNSTLNFTTQGSTRTYFFSNPNLDGYGSQINYMFTDLNTSAIDLTYTLPYSDLTNWASRETSGYDVYRFDYPSTYTEETVTTDYTYEDNTGSEFVQFNWPATNAPLDKQYVNLTWTAIVVTYECNDGVDNDGDGDIDYPADAGCSGETDDSEDSDTPAGGGGGGGGGGAPDDDDEIDCKVSIDPQIIKFSENGIKQVTVFNSGISSYNPQISISGDIESEVSIVNTIFPLLPSKGDDMGIRYDSDIFKEGDSTITLTDSTCGELKILVSATSGFEVITIVDTFFSESEGIGGYLLGAWNLLREPVVGLDNPSLRERTSYINFGVLWFISVLIGAIILYIPITSAFRANQYLRGIIWILLLLIMGFVLTVFIISGIRSS